MDEERNFEELLQTLDDPFGFCLTPSARPDPFIAIADSLLFSLPREIRDEIYGLYLQPTIGWVFSECNSPLALLQACRAVHAEAEQRLYEVRPFKVKFNLSSQSRLPRLPRSTSMIARISVVEVVLFDEAIDEMSEVFQNLINHLQELHNANTLGIRYAGSRHRRCIQQEIRWAFESLPGFRVLSYCQVFCNPYALVERAPPTHQESASFSAKQC